MKNRRWAGWRVLAAGWALCLIAATAATAAETSELWGKNGGKWRPQSRLPDFSYAGYHCGEAPLPNLPRGVSVKDFGARGDGVADDSQAFLDALAKAPQGAIEVPAGRYKITKILEITRPGVVLRGAGADKSVLYFPSTLTDIKPNWGATTTAQRTSNYSWSGGFVWLKGSLGQKTLATVKGEARRGDQALPLDSAASLKPGQWILIAQRDPGDKTLVDYLYGGDPGDTQNLRNARAEMACRVTQVEGNTLHFDRPLRFDVRPAWGAQIKEFAPSVRESGVENLCFEFPNTPYKGHFTELGYNAIAMSKVADCWARNIRIVNADSGIFPSGVFCTIQGVTLESARAAEKERNATGHHGICLEGDDNLVTDFQFKTRFMHEITVQGSAGNVCARGPAWTSVSTTTSKRPTPTSLRTSTPVKGRDCGSAAEGRRWARTAVPGRPSGTSGLGGR